MARLSLLSCALLLACGRGHPDDAQPAEPPSLLLSTLYGDQWMGADGAGSVLGRYDLAARHPEACSGEGRYCLGYQARARVAWDGATEVIFTFSSITDHDGSDQDRTDRLGTLAGADAEGFTLRWEVDQLDFSGLDDGARYCSWDPDDACLPAPGLGDRDFQRCFLYQPHDLQVIAEDDAGLELWVSDSRNARLLRLSVARESPCAEVLEVLGTEHPDWGNANAPNSFQWWADAAGEHLLWSAKDSFAQDGGGEGRGRILYWTKAGETWSQAWAHPEQGYVNSPHGLTLWGDPAQPEGEGRLLFAHSLGLGRDWNEGPGGTLAALSWDAEGAQYLGEWTLPRGLNYPRDVLVDGDSAWIADSGCKGGSACERSMGLMRVALPQDPEPQDVDGAWTSANTAQVIGELELLGGPWYEGERLIYSVEAMP